MYPPVDTASATRMSHHPCNNIMSISKIGAYMNLHPAYAAVIKTAYVVVLIINGSGHIGIDIYPCFGNAR